MEPAHDDGTPGKIPWFSLTEGSEKKCTLLGLKSILAQLWVSKAFFKHPFGIEHKPIIVENHKGSAK